MKDEHTTAYLALVLVVLIVSYPLMIYIVEQQHNERSMDISSSVDSGLVGSV